MINKLLLKKKNNQGFTLIELMIVVVIIGILAATAIPAFLRFVARSKTAEAGLQLKAMFDGAASYYTREFSQQGWATNLTTLTNCVVGNAVTPNAADAGKTVIGVFPSEFLAIDWAPSDPLYFNYQIDGTGTNAGCGNVPAAGGPVQTFRANGDIDGDDVSSLFEMSAGINSNFGFSHGALYFAPATELE